MLYEQAIRRIERSTNNEGQTEHRRRRNIACMDFFPLSSLLRRPPACSCSQFSSDFKKRVAGAVWIADGACLKCAVVTRRNFRKCPRRKKRCAARPTSVSKELMHASRFYLWCSTVKTLSNRRDGQMQAHIKRRTLSRSRT